MIDYVLWSVSNYVVGSVYCILVDPGAGETLRERFGYNCTSQFHDGAYNSTYALIAMRLSKHTSASCSISFTISSAGRICLINPTELPTIPTSVVVLHRKKSAYQPKLRSSQRPPP